MTGSFSMPSRPTGMLVLVPPSASLHTPESVANILGAPKGGGREDPGQGIRGLGLGRALVPALQK